MGKLLLSDRFVVIMVIILGLPIGNICLIVALNEHLKEMKLTGHIHFIVNFYLQHL